MASPTDDKVRSIESFRQSRDAKQRLQELTHVHQEVRRMVNASAKAASALQRARGQLLTVCHAGERAAEHIMELIHCEEAEQRARERSDDAPVPEPIPFPGDDRAPEPADAPADPAKPPRDPHPVY